MSGVGGRQSRIAWGVVAVLLAGDGARAQSDQEVLEQIERISRELDNQYRLRVAPDQPILERVLLDHRFSGRLAFSAIDDEFSSTRILRQSEICHFEGGVAQSMSETESGIHINGIEVIQHLDAASMQDAPVSWRYVNEKRRPPGAKKGKIISR